MIEYNGLRCMKRSFNGTEYTVSIRLITRCCGKIIVSHRVSTLYKGDVFSHRESRSDFPITQKGDDRNSVIALFLGMGEC